MTNKKALLIIYITIFIDIASWGLIIPITPELIKELIGSSITEAAKYGGLLTFVYSFNQFLFAPLIGNLSDRYGRRPIILNSLFIFFLSYIIMIYSSNIIWLFIGRFLCGISGACITASTSYIADISKPENRTKNFGLIGVAFGLGFIIGPFIGGFLGTYGTRIPFYAAALLCLMNFLLGYFLLPESLKVDNRREFDLKRANPLGSLINLIKKPLLIKPMFAFFLMYIASHAIYGNRSYYTMYRFNWSGNKIGMSLAYIGFLFMIVQGVLLRRINKKIGNKKSVIYGMTLYMIGMFLFSFANEGWMMILFLIPYCMGGITDPSLKTIFSLNVSMKEQGELQGILTSLVSAASMIGPPLMSYVFFFFTQPSTPFQFTGAPFVLGGILIFIGLVINLFSLNSLDSERNNKLVYMNNKISYKLSMPQMFFGGISENWFLKEFGDIHWQQIASSYNTESDKLIDSNGNRIYASFVRLKWESNRDLAAFKENDSFGIKSEISRFGNKMFFSEQELTGNRKKITASLMTVFSSRSINNTTLQKSVPISKINDQTINHEILPEFAKGFLNVKSNLFGEGEKKWEHHLKSHIFSESSGFIAEYTYEIEPFNDINGVGLLYFASYPIINDKCERKVFNDLFEIENSDWSQLSSCAARDIFYFGNANPEDKLIYRLNNYEFVGHAKVYISSSLYRLSDNVLISKQFSVRNLVKDWEKRIVKQENFIETETQKKKITNCLPDSNDAIQVDQNKLVVSICSFLSKMLGGIKITGNSELSNLGIESILFMELSEYLNFEFKLTTNPSKFYGFKNTNEIVNSILHLEDRPNEDQPEIQTKQDDIAIIATSFKIPGAKNINEFWQMLKNGESAITELPNDRWSWPLDIDLNNTHRGINMGGFIEGIKNFDPSFFNISPVEAELMDPQQRLLLELSWELFERANYKPSIFKGKNVGVFIGASGSDYEQLTYLSDEKLSVTGTASALLSNRISYFFDLKGPSKTIDTACSSSLVALHDAVNAIKNGDCTDALVGGIHLMCNSSKTISYYNSKMLSIDGQCKTFDENANGYVRAEGGVMFLLKPLSKAINDNDQILGIIKSTATNHGGRVSGVTVPNPWQQASLVRNALNKAGLSLNDISYIEVHGTGTSLGDPIEINGLNEVSKNTEIIKNSCALGSVKTNIGHLEAASGLAGVLKIIVAMKAKKLPPSINFLNLNPKIDFIDGPFYVQKQLQNWELKNGHKERFSGVSNFGVGGSNAHVILSSGNEVSEQKKGVFTEPNHLLFILSAKTEKQLQSYAQNIARYLKENEECNLSAFSKTLQIAKEEMTYRLAFVFNDKEELKTKLKNFILGEKSAYHWGKINEFEESTIESNIIESTVNRANIAINLNEIAKRWVAGDFMDWSQFNANNCHLLYDLPTYPFAEEEYWLPKCQKSIKKPLKITDEIGLEPIKDYLEFTTDFINTAIRNTGNQTGLAMSFPILIRQIAKEIDQKKKYLLKNVFWTPFDTNQIKSNQFQTKIVNENGEVFFELSTENNPLFFGELIENKQNDSTSVMQLRKRNTTIEFSEPDIERINKYLRQTTGMFGTVSNLVQDQNSYLGEIMFDIERNSQPEYSDLLSALWTIYTLIKDRNEGRSISQMESDYPYFSSEMNLNGKLNSVLTFKIDDNHGSSDMCFYDQSGVEQLSIKGLKRGKITDSLLISN